MTCSRRTGFVICASPAPPSPPPSPPPARHPAVLPLTDAMRLPCANVCNITNGGTCISDLNYGDDERCTFRAEAIISVSATTFDTEAYYDYITIGGTRYSGTSGPSDVVMAAGETIGGTAAGGFVICASPAPPSPPPSPPSPRLRRHLHRRHQRLPNRPDAA